MYVDIRGGRIAYDQAGSGEAVLFLHSLGTSKAIWERQVRVFSRRFRCIAADSPGHGGSTSPGPIDEQSIVDAHATLLEVLGVERAHVVGVSMGGCWAMRMWHRYPAGVRSLVICDSFASLHDPQATIRAREETLARTDMATFGRQYAAAVFKGAPTEQARRAVAESIAVCSKDAYLQTARATYRFNAEPFLASIDVPTLVITGDRDDRIPPSNSEHLAAAIAGAELRVIPEAGHLPHLDNPDAFDAALEDFLVHTASRAR